MRKFGALGWDHGSPDVCTWFYITHPTIPALQHGNFDNAEMEGN